MYFISDADILFWGLLSEKKLSYPSDCLPFIFVAIKTPVNRHVSSDFIYLHETVLANYSWSSLKS
jgi:hypothetical protein